MKQQILIRKAKKGDGKGIAENFNEGLKSRFNQYTGSNQFFDKKKIKKMEKEFSGYSKWACSFVAIDKKTGQIVGSAVFSGREKGRLNHRLEFGWGVNPRYAKQGIATILVSKLIQEAKKRGFKKVQAEACIKNIGSVKLAKKLGFKIEGKRKLGMKLDNGKYADTYIFGRVL